MKSRYVLLIAAASCIACGEGVPTLFNGIAPIVTSGDTVTMSAARGPMIAFDSLTVVDHDQLPCCARDSAGVHIQVTGGQLTFYAAASYGEMMFTPVGPLPVACVQYVPDEATTGINKVVTLLDGTRYLLLPCTAGYFSATLTEQLGYADGSSSTRQVTLSSGRYGWQRNLLSLTEQGTAPGAIASMSDATITVTVPGHSYAFLALRSF